MKNLIPQLQKKTKKILFALTGTIAFVLICAILISHTLLPVSTGEAAYSSDKTSSIEHTDKNAPVNTGKKAKISGEMRAVWISFLEYNKKGYSQASWKSFINKTLNDCKAKKFNTVIVHVRPFSDAMYPSAYYPWSKFSSGKIGKNPGFDPLAYAVNAAHQRGLAFHAWINPYRITKDTTKISALAKGSTIYNWATSKNTSKRRNVLKYGGQLYLNPARKEVQTLVTNGVSEIVSRYNIDGIHFDDYFYPNLGNGYRKNFDAKEYKSYVRKCRQKGKSATSIVTWRRNNVSRLLKRIHSKVHKLDPKCVFGISPAGNLTNLYAKTNYYADVKKWMKSDKYIDYICPQIYWSFKQSSCPYKRTVDKWCSLSRNENVKMYIGIAGYRAGISAREARAITDPSWSKSNTILKRQVQYLRQKKCNGFALFSYQDLNRSTAAKELQNLRSIL